MNKKKIIKEYFNKHAAQWDAEMRRNDAVINQILDNANVFEDKDVLDVACGTGVLIPDYLMRNVKSVTGIDFSEEMIKRARQKFEQKKVTFICGDVEQVKFEKKFDCVVIYNAFPHFMYPRKVIEILSDYLKEDGILTIAHGMSREQINRHHSGRAKDISIDLMDIEELAKLFESRFKIKMKISTDEMYQVVGIKKKGLLQK